MDYKTSAIAQLWNGELEPYRNLGGNDTETKELENLILSNYEKLEESLSGELKERLEKYRECSDEYMASINEQAFCEGFCLGTRLTAEALTNE